MIWNTETYTVYKRGGKYHICAASFNHMLEKDEIEATGLSRLEARNLASDLFWKNHPKI